ncbi:MAG: hypothetical protein WBE20_06685 [Candidatus Acidiferrales bacterium]
MVSNSRRDFVKLAAAKREFHAAKKTALRRGERASGAKWRRRELRAKMAA